MLRLLTIYCLLFSANVDAQSLRLWYDKPAVEWEEAMPIGNGRLGAMVFGGTTLERFQLNEDSFWAGSPHDNNNPKGKEVLKEVQQLIFDGKYAEAQALAAKGFVATKVHGMRSRTLLLYLLYPGDRVTSLLTKVDWIRPSSIPAAACEASFRNSAFRAYSRSA